MSTSWAPLPRGQLDIELQRQQVMTPMVTCDEMAAWGSGDPMPTRASLAKMAKLQVLFAAKREQPLFSSVESAWPSSDGGYGVRAT